MKREHVSAALEVGGATAMVVGVGSVSTAAGMVAAGVIAWLFSWRLARGGGA